MSQLPLNIQDLNHAYQGHPVLRDLSFSVKPGEFVAVLGPSGCGKTTLLRAIAGLLTPDGGAIEIAGRRVCENGRLLIPPQKRRVGLVFQEYALFPNLTVAENIAFGLQKGETKRVMGLLDLMGMGDLAQRYPRALSGGQQQRVALARALAPNPHLLLLDEPFANVDTQRRDLLGQSLRESVKREASSVLLVTHDRIHALSLADRVVLLNADGHGPSLSQIGSPEALYLRPKSRVIGELTGDGTYLTGHCMGEIAETILGNIPVQAAEMGGGTVMIRPEWLDFQAQDGGEAQVKDILFLGDRYKVRVQWKGVDFHLFAQNGQLPPRGSLGQLIFKRPAFFIAD